MANLPFLFVIACTVSEDVEESSVAWDATNFTMFNEFMECFPGEDFSEELMMQMICERCQQYFFRTVFEYSGYILLNKTRHHIIQCFHIKLTASSTRVILIKII